MRVGVCDPTKETKEKTMEKLTVEDIANFTWMWGQEFFLETAKGNYIWRDPDYGGDNTIRPYHGSYRDFLEEIGVEYGRDKGKHFISEYCGSQVQIVEIE
jgi:hypothetical protein